MKLRGFRLGSLAAILPFLVGPRPASARPILVEFEGVLADINDAGGLAGLFDLEPGGVVDGFYLIDLEAGTIEFGDGIHGARLPSGGSVVAGTYRTGAGEGTLTLLDDCYLSIGDCRPDEGGDAYLVELSGAAQDGIAFALLLELSGRDASIFSEHALPLLPPELKRFENGRFLLTLSGPNGASELGGSLTSIQPVPEPGSLLLLGLGGVVLGMRTRRQRNGVQKRLPNSLVALNGSGGRTPVVRIGVARRMPTARLLSCR
jgi:hypothetical protein